MTTNIHFHPCGVTPKIITSILSQKKTIHEKNKRQENILGFYRQGRIYAIQGEKKENPYQKEIRFYPADLILNLSGKSYYRRIWAVPIFFQ